MIKPRAAVGSDTDWQSFGEISLEDAVIQLGGRAKGSLQGRRLIEVCELERRRIARELHDDMSQRLALLCLDLDQLKVAQDDQGAGERLTRIRAQAQQIARDLHHITLELHPERRITNGLATALKDLCAQLSARSGIEIEFHYTHQSRRLPGALALCVYRLVQEGLRNVLRHSGARQALVEIAERSDELEIRIADSGIGFALSSLGVESFGLLSMQERVHQFGGRLVVHTAPGTGTRIGIRIPIAGTRVPPLATAS
jgi:signal transduction histidine kinase